VKRCSETFAQEMHREERPEDRARSAGSPSRPRNGLREVGAHPQEDSMTVIAMTREMGSGSRDVALRVSEKLGLKLILHELVEHDVAEQMQVRESDIHHRLEGGDSLLERWQIGSKKLASYVAEEVYELAQKGNVLIRGWGACVILSKVPHVVRVRICAPIEVRENSVMSRTGVDRVAARAEIERNDAAHERILRVTCGVEREDALLYDVVLNTGRVSIDTCVKVICDLVERPEYRETDLSRSFLDDIVLEARLRTKLRERFTLGTGVSWLEAKVTDGRVLLTGMAVHKALAAEAVEIVTATKGVKSLDNHIQVVRGPHPL
jgi:cytidylate kinase